jgi:hypothetical protein
MRLKGVRVAPEVGYRYWDDQVIVHHSETGQTHLLEGSLAGLFWAIVQGKQEVQPGDAEDHARLLGDLCSRKLVLKKPEESGQAGRQ